MLILKVLNVELSVNRHSHGCAVVVPHNSVTLITTSDSNATLLKYLHFKTETSSFLCSAQQTGKPCYLSRPLTFLIINTQH